ncbi:hypothetical protein AMS68_003536 [Peltaster fructicola]|uniref:Eukaryotic translation initiation factor 3 subunit M n=1 Tax=Peltaster fructicola TaxID=286661 RepID=A0A6H0XTS5_9PEZI|nr:hypothetical protein AMS68_003536 [Peltaster fructicola]
MPGLPKLSLVEGAFEELALELATYLDTLRGDDSKVVAEVSPLLANTEKEDRPQETDKEAVLKKLVTASSALNSAPERELQAAYNLLIHLITQAPEPDTFLPPLCRYLSAPITTSQANGTGIALSIFGTIFNAIQPDDESRYHVLLAIVEVIRRSNNFEVLSSQLSNLDDWVEQWELEPEEIKKLSLTISETAAAAGETEISYVYLLKGLRTLQKEPGSTEARELSLKALKEALQNEKHFDFEDLTSLDSVQSLRKSDQTWFELLELYSSENFDDLQDFKEANGSFFSSNGLNEDVLDRKMRLLTLASLAAQASHTRTLAYAQIFKALAVPAEDVESWVIDSIRSGLVEGKLSQQKQEFLIHRSTYRVFGENQWREVASRLETWRSSLVSVLEVIRAQKAEYIKDKEAELSGAQHNGQGYRPNYRQRNAPQQTAVEVE